MAINIQDEELLTLADAARALPRIGGRKPHTSTLWRWARRGIKGVHLEYARFGSRITTSREALSRFVNALAAADSVPVPTASNTRTTSRESTPRARAAAIKSANDLLAKDGI